MSSKQTNSSKGGCLIIVVILLGIVFLWVTKWLGAAIVATAILWFIEYAIFPAQKRSEPDSDSFESQNCPNCGAPLLPDGSCEYCKRGKKR